MNQSGPTAGGRTATGRYVLVGGFPGAGKTAALSKLATWLREHSISVGVITSDHGNGIVDSTTFRAQGLPTEQIEGGCFCSRFDALTDAAERLDYAFQPEVFLAEAAGTCVDLRATVAHPLKRFSPTQVAIAPVSVLIDPLRALRFLGAEPGDRFSENIGYIYRKQLEEADLIIINKNDLLTRDKINNLRKNLERNFPNAIILELSARDGSGTEEWFQCVMTKEQPARAATELDYQRYAEAEGRLGCANCTVQFSTVKYFDSGTLLMDLATSLQSLLQQEGASIAHLKMAISSEELPGLAVISLARSDAVPELSQHLPEPVQSAEMILSVRAEADPELLNAVINRALMAVIEKSPELFVRMKQSDHFRPARPLPTHRIPQPV